MKGRGPILIAFLLSLAFAVLASGTAQAIPVQWDFTGTVSGKGLSGYTVTGHLTYDNGTDPTSPGYYSQIQGSELEIFIYASDGSQYYHDAFINLDVTVTNNAGTGPYTDEFKVTGKGVDDQSKGSIDLIAQGASLPTLTTSSTLPASVDELYLAGATQQTNAVFGSDGGKIAGFQLTSLTLSDASATGSDPDPSVPEPSTLLLLGSGMVGLVGLGRTKLRRE